jgi:hypothetical protein
MNPFDKFCAVLAFVLGAVFLILGVLGLFIGCSANFTLPPILGAIPAFVGWGIIRSIVIAWRAPRYPPPADYSSPTGPTEPIEPRPPSTNPYDAPRY